MSEPSLLTAAVLPSSDTTERVLVPRALLLGQGRTPARWCLIDTRTRHWKLVDGRAGAMLRLALADVGERFDPIAVTRRLTLAICSRYLTRPGSTDGTAGAVAAGRDAPATRRRHPSAGDLGAVSVRRVTDSADTGPYTAITADLATLLTRYRQPRSAYLPFLEAGHILENMALAGGETDGCYQVGPWLSPGLELRIARLGQERQVAPPEPDRPGWQVNPTLLIVIRAAGLHAVVTWPQPRHCPLPESAFDSLSRLLAGESVTSLDEPVVNLLRSQKILVDQMPPGYGELAAAGWHGAVPGWLGASYPAGDRSQALPSSPLLPPADLARAYAHRRSTHVFTEWVADERRIGQVLRSVHSEQRRITMRLVIVADGHRVLRWTGERFTATHSGPSSDLVALRARPALTAPAGYLLLTGDPAGEPDDFDLSSRLIALGRVGQRVILALAAHGLASCPLHIDDDAAAHRLVETAGRVDPTYVIAFGRP